MPRNKSPEELITIIESERRLRDAERLAKIGSWELDLITNDLKWSDEIYRILTPHLSLLGRLMMLF